MSLVIDSTGVQIQTFQEIYDELVAGYKAVYGEDINLDADSPDGQRIAIEAKARHDMQQFGLAIANNFDPALAQGLALASISKLAGIYPRAATKSSWDITVTVSYDTTLPVGYTITDELDQDWALETEAACTTGANTVTFLAVEWGAVKGLLGATLTQATPDLAVVSLAAPANSTDGVDAETDEEFRQRRNRSLEMPALSTVGSLYARLAELPGVTDALIYENATAEEDIERDIAPHTIWCIVEAGEVADIAEAIVKNKTGGTGLKGSVEETWTEEMIRPDGSTFEIIHTVLFDRPVDAPVHVRLTVAPRLPGDEYDVEAIQDAIAAYAFRIGDALQAGQLYAQAYEAGETFIVTDLEISDDEGGTWTDGQISPDYGAKFSIDAANVTVSE